MRWVREELDMRPGPGNPTPEPPPSQPGLMGDTPPRSGPAA